MARPPDPAADYERLKPRCIASLRRRAGGVGDHDADALYQTAWIALWHAVEQGRRVDDPAAFLLTVMYRRLLDERRRARRRPEVPLRTAVVDRTAGALGMPDLDGRDRLRAALDALAGATRGDEELRRVFELAWFAGMTRREAAQALGLPWGRPLQRRLDRASKRLRISLDVARR